MGFLAGMLLICSYTPWPSPPDTISTAGVDATAQSAGSDENGNVIVVWLENGVVKSNSANVSGSWEATPETVSGSGASSPQVVMDDSGNATCVWVEGGIVFASEKPLGGSWSAAPDVLSGYGASSSQISADEVGNLVAVWIENGYVMSATKLFGGSWPISPDTLSSAGSSVPQVAIGSDGTVAVVWQGVVGSIPAVFAATKSISGLWNPANAISSSGENSAVPNVAVSSSGDVAAIWFSYDVNGTVYSNVVAQSSLLPLNGLWSTPVTLSAPGYRNPADLKCQVNYSAAGDIMAVWNNSMDGAAFVFEYSIYTDGSWNTPFTMQTANFMTYSFDSRIDDRGNVYVAWMFYDPVDNLSKIVAILNDISGINKQIAVYWLMSTTGMNAYPDVAIANTSSNVYGVCSWINYDGSNNRVQAIKSSYAAIQPPINLAVTQRQNNYGFLTEYENVLTWDPSPSQNVNNYFIYRNGLFLATVYQLPFEYIDQNCDPAVRNTYQIAAYDTYGCQSLPATVNYPP